MANTIGSKKYTDAERAILINAIADYTLFGVQEPEMLHLLAKKIGRNSISERSLYNLKKEVKERQGSAEQWLDKYAQTHIADFYRQRIEELQYLQANLFLILDQEKSKGIDKINIYRYNTIAKTIIENSKVLAEFGLAPPIISKIKDLLPVDINELNQRVERQKSLVDDAINITDSDIIETRETLTENEQSELERLQATRRSAKSAYRLQPDEQNTRDSSGESEYSTNSQDERVF